jgi:hypothetical protein
LETLDTAISVGRQKPNKSLVVAALLLSNGVALAHYSDTEDTLKRFDLALERWKECYGITSKEEYSGQYMSMLVSRFIATAYLEPIISKRAAGIDSLARIAELTDLGKEAASSYFIAVNHRNAVAAYHTLLGEPDKAREHLKHDLQVGLDLLSDEDPDNDYEGWLKISEVCVHTGDLLGSLSAWSLIQPNDIEEKFAATGKAQEVAQSGEQSETPDKPETEETVRSGPAGNTCDGRCGVVWSYANDVYICLYCTDVQFDSGCVEKLKKGELDRFICHPDHLFVHIPAWTDEAWAGKDRVRIGGELVDGKRIGGEVVTVTEWLNLLRKQWGIPMPVVESTPTETAGEAENAEKSVDETPAEASVPKTNGLVADESVTNMVPFETTGQNVSIQVTALESVAVA